MKKTGVLIVSDVDLENTSSLDYEHERTEDQDQLVVTFTMSDGSKDLRCYRVPEEHHPFVSQSMEDLTAAPPEACTEGNEEEPQNQDAYEDLLDDVLEEVPDGNYPIDPFKKLIPFGSPSSDGYEAEDFTEEYELRMARRFGDLFVSGSVFLGLIYGLHEWVNQTLGSIWFGFFGACVLLGVLKLVNIKSIKRVWIQQWTNTVLYLSLFGSVLASVFLYGGGAFNLPLEFYDSPWMNPLLNFLFLGGWLWLGIGGFFEVLADFKYKKGLKFQGEYTKNLPEDTIIRSYTPAFIAFCGSTYLLSLVDPEISHFLFRISVVFSFLFLLKMFNDDVLLNLPLRHVLDWSGFSVTVAALFGEFYLLFNGSFYRILVIIFAHVSHKIPFDIPFLLIIAITITITLALLVTSLLSLLFLIKKYLEGSERGGGSIPQKIVWFLYDMFKQALKQSLTAFIN